ncbi:hypothetical protein ACFL27_04380 [candidate division CSSED10-310 bacterium]|uniref:GWxTD domain-containing protein n=1 Tax=candidate division CSSED10-310 bacterium TaxID=2855610 RepID=A0ABV6YTB3_UNCC1
MKSHNRKLKYLFICILCSHLILSSCAHSPLTLMSPEDSVSTDLSLQKIIQQWSRQKQVHSRWSTILDVEAIFLSWEIRKLMLDRIIENQKLEPERAQAMLDREKAIFNGYIEFYVAVFTTRDEWNNLDADEPVWHVFFSNDQNQESPSYRVEIADLDPSLKFSFFPTISKWKTIYKVSFLRRASDQESFILDHNARFFSLFFKGYLGHVSLLWKLAAQT